MLLFLRILAVVLALTTGGIFETVAHAAADEAGCVDEGAGGCSDCSPACTVCICCPSRAMPTSTAVVLRQVLQASEPALGTLREPVVSIRVSDIFQPPRA